MTITQKNNFISKQQITNAYSYKFNNNIQTNIMKVANYNKKMANNNNKEKDISGGN